MREIATTNAIHVSILWARVMKATSIPSVRGRACIEGLAEFRQLHSLHLHLPQLFGDFFDPLLFKSFGDVMEKIIVIGGSVEMGFALCFFIFPRMTNLLHD